MNITEKSGNFAKNLNLIREFKGWSMAEFAAEIAIPRSTLQTVLNSGQTTLDTALRIAHQLGIPLDTLTNGVLSPQDMSTAFGFLYTLDWYSRISAEEQQEALGCLLTLFRLIQRGGK